MPDVYFDEMKKLYPDLSDNEVVAKIEAAGSQAEQPPSLVPEPNPYRDMAVENVRRKYLGDRYSDENRQKLVKEAQDDASGPNLMAGLAAFGTGLTGGNAAGAGQEILKNQAARRNQKLQEFDIGRQNQMADVKTGQELLKFDKDEQQISRERDANSAESKLAVGLAQKMLPQRDFKGMTAEQVNKLLPSVTKFYEIEQKKLDRQDARVAAKSAKEEARAYADAVREENRSERRDARQEKLDAKQADEAKLNNKQVEGIADFDTTIDKAQAALSSLGDHSDWTGAVDARIPDMLVGADQVGFRSAVGRMADAYRKLITGAGASNQELARLEGRLPQTTDTFENFKAKAKSLIEETKRARESHLGAYEKSGKNVKEFRGDQVAPGGLNSGGKPSWAK